MKFEAKLNADDVQFVEATRDNEKRQARRERLSRSRRILGRVLTSQMVCLILIMLVTTDQVVTHDPNISYLSPICVWGMIGLFIAYYLYLDLQIKFLKADEARFSIGSGGQSGTTTAS